MHTGRPPNHKPRYRPSEEVRRQLIFSSFGITDTVPWEERDINELVPRLRKNANLTEEQAGLLFHPPVSKEWVRHLETSPDAEHIRTMAEVLRPKLREMVNDGWLKKESFSVNWERVDGIAIASKHLLTRETAQKKGWPEGVESFSADYIKKFERNPSAANNNPNAPRSIPDIISYTTSLCALHGCITPEELIRKGQEAAKVAPVEFTFTLEGKQAIGEALGTILQKLHLPTRALYALAPQGTISRFINEGILMDDRIKRIPAAVVNARREAALDAHYREKYGVEIPPSMNWRSVEDFEKQGCTHEEALYRCVRDFTETGFHIREQAGPRHHLPPAERFLRQRKGEQDQLVLALRNSQSSTVGAGRR